MLVAISPSSPTAKLCSMQRKSRLLQAAQRWSLQMAGSMSPRISTSARHPPDQRHSLPFLQYWKPPPEKAAPSSHTAPCQGEPYLGLLLTRDRKSTRLNSSHVAISYAAFCLKKKRDS